MDKQPRDFQSLFFKKTMAYMWITAILDIKMQRREIMRFEFKEQKEKAKVSECFTKQGVSDNAYCVKYYLHKKKTICSIMEKKRMVLQIKWSGLLFKRWANHGIRVCLVQQKRTP